MSSGGGCGRVSEFVARPQNASKSTALELERPRAHRQVRVECERLCCGCAITARAVAGDRLGLAKAVTQENGMTSGFRSFALGRRSQTGARQRASLRERLGTVSSLASRKL